MPELFSLKTLLLSTVTLALLSGCAVASGPVSSESAPKSLPEVVEQVLTPGCTDGPMPTGEEGRDLLIGVEWTFVAGECFDVLHAPDFWLSTAGQRYLDEEFCKKLGIETDLNAILGHGRLFLGSDFNDDDFNGEISGLLAGTCTYQLPWEDNRPVDDIFSINAIEITWVSTGYSFVGDNPLYSFQRDVSNLPFTEYDDIGEYAVRVDKSDTVASFAAISPLEDRTQIFASVIVDFSPRHAEVASDLTALAPGILAAALVRGEELMNAYFDGSAYALYREYPENQ